MPYQIPKVTDEMREIIRRDYRGTDKSRDELCERFGLTKWQMHYALQGMALSYRWNERYWTEKEDNYLKENVDRFSEAKLAKNLKRSKNSIKVRLTRLSLSRRNRNGWYTLKETCEILGQGHHKVDRWIKQGILPATYHHGHKPQKNGSGYWHIMREDLATFIRHYPQELVGRNIDVIQIVEILVGLGSINYMNARIKK